MTTLIEKIRIVLWAAIAVTFISIVGFVIYIRLLAWNEAELFGLTFALIVIVLVYAIGEFLMPSKPIHVFGADNTMRGEAKGPSFAVTAQDFHLIGKITQRAAEMCAARGLQMDYMTHQMDIVACHCNGCELKLLQLLMSDNADFAHDFFGICNNIDRSTGKLLNLFQPRFAKTE